MPGCMPLSDHEAVAAEAKSFTGQYLKPLFARSSSVRPEPVEGRPSRKRAKPHQPDLIPAK